MKEITLLMLTCFYQTLHNIINYFTRGLFIQEIHFGKGLNLFKNVFNPLNNERDVTLGGGIKSCIPS